MDTTVPPSPITRERGRDGARLVLVHPGELAAARPLGSETITVGRAAGTGCLEVAHRTVSRQHVTIRWDPGLSRHIVHDLGSKNGTRVGGTRMSGDERVLTDGAVLRVGEVLLVYEQGPSVDLPDAPEVAREAVPGDAAATRRLRATIAAVARDRTHVVVLGETGTGKELIARELHRLSRRSGPFIAVSCPELTGELMESRLFGHARGAFTGAVQAERGLFRAADGGTLLLDEIGELPPALQPKLLRVLQEGVVMPVGETRAVKVDVRVIGATHRDLAGMVERGAFRRDLHARLTLAEVSVPPLRARRADLAGWLDRLDARLPRPAHPTRRLTADAVEAILLAPWPDNLRGLDRLVHRLAAEGGDEAVSLAQIEPLLGPAPDEDSAPGAAPRRPAPTTREELEAAFAENEGSIRAVARHYGRDRKQIHRWMKTFGLR